MSLNSSVSSAQYWRERREWSRWLGRKGVVVQSTLVQVAPPELEAFTPYAVVLVDFGDIRHMFLGVDSKYVVGDVIECVWRRLATEKKSAIIRYGIKVKKTSELSIEKPSKKLSTKSTKKSPNGSADNSVQEIEAQLDNPAPGNDNGIR